MATTEAGGDGFEFLSHPVLQPPDLGGGEATLDGECSETLVCPAAESNIGDVGDAALTVQLDLNNTCERLSLSAPNSEQSTRKDDPQTLGWTKRVRVGNAPAERTPCAGRVSVLEKTLRGYAEMKTVNVVVPEMREEQAECRENKMYAGNTLLMLGRGSLERKVQKLGQHNLAPHRRPSREQVLLEAALLSCWERTVLHKPLEPPQRGANYSSTKEDDPKEDANCSSTKEDDSKEEAAYWMNDTFDMTSCQMRTFSMLPM